VTILSYLRFTSVSVSCLTFHFKVESFQFDEIRQTDTGSNLWQPQINQLPALIFGTFKADEETFSRPKIL
jgi:hypothetical protein